MKHIPSDRVLRSGIIAKQQARHVSRLRLTEEHVLGERRQQLVQKELILHCVEALGGMQNP